MKKGVMFGDLFGKSWAIFKSKFVLLVGLVFVFSFVPNLIYTFWMNGRTDIFAGEGVPIASEVFRELSAVAPGILLLLVSSIFMSVSVIYLLNVKSRKILSFSEVIKGGSGFLLKGILLYILLMVFLIPLYLLFVIPGVIFSMYWAFAFNALIIDKTSVRKALSKSYEVVRGRWWKIFGYFLLYTLIVYGVIILPGLVFALLGIVGSVLDIALSSLVAVFGLVFFNEFYLSLRKG